MGAQTLGQKQILTDPEANMTSVLTNVTTSPIGTSYTTLYSLTGKSGRIDNININFTSGSLTDFYVKITVDGVVVTELRITGSYHFILGSYGDLSYTGSGNQALSYISSSSGAFQIGSLPMNVGQMSTLPYFPSLASPFGLSFGICANYGVYFKNSITIEVKVTGVSSNCLYFVRGGYQ